MTPAAKRLGQKHNGYKTSEITFPIRKNNQILGGGAVQVGRHIVKKRGTILKNLNVAPENVARISPPQLEVSWQIRCYKVKLLVHVSWTPCIYVPDTISTLCF